MIPIFQTKNLMCFGQLTYPDIQIEGQGITFLCGESGCGKSTFLKMLNLTQSASRGSILFQNRNINEYDTIELRRKVLLVSQNVFLFEGTIEENFQLFNQYREEPMISREEMERYLALCQGDFPLTETCERMSGGERQRIFLAICLSMKPEVVLLDEPTSALDSQTAHKLMEALTKLTKEQNMTMIVVSHDMALAQEYGNHIIMLSGREES